MGPGAMTFRTILFLVENRASSLGKDRIWRSEWFPLFPILSPVLSAGLWARERGFLIPCPRVMLVRFFVAGKQHCQRQTDSQGERYSLVRGLEVQVA